ncbi:MAG: DsbA family protein [bacterium]|nr:DsbA family protein [bacterium]
MSAAKKINKSKTSPSTRKRWFATWWGVSFIGAIIIFLGTVIWFAYEVIGSFRDLAYSTDSPNSSIPSVPATSALNTLVTSDDPSAGTADAKVQIVEFSDFQCPFCRQASGIVRTIMLEYGSDIHYVYRDFPVTSVHPEAQIAAEAGECAHEQDKFWELHDRIFQNQNALESSNLKTYAQQAGLNVQQFNTCLDSGRHRDEVLEDFQAGLEAGVAGTPTFFINGSIVPGVIPLETFREIIDQLLDRV